MDNQIALQSGCDITGTSKLRGNGNSALRKSETGRFSEERPVPLHRKFFYWRRLLFLTGPTKTNEEELEKMEVSRDQGLNEIFASIFAGGDTTSTVLGGIFFHLLANPSVLDRLREEVDAAFPPGEGEPFDAVKLSGMPFLNAVMYVLFPPEIVEKMGR